MTITIDTSTLTGWYQSRSAVSGRSAASTTRRTQPKDPTPPWSTSATTPRASALAKAVLAGARFIDPGAAKLDAPAAEQSEDYKKLFALYQGLNALSGLTDQALAKGVSSGELARIQTRFAAGMQEVGKFLATKPFGDFEVAQGTVAAKAQTTVGPKIETSTYATRTLYAGLPDDAVPAFAGDVRFTMTATKVGGVQVPIDFNLADMGSEPRSMPNVVNYMNGKLADAGLITRMQLVRTPAPAETVKTGTTTLTLPAGPDRFSLKIRGDSTESLNFTAPVTRPAVFITQGAGAVSPSQELLKFDAGAGASPAPLVKTALGAAVATARATVTAPDGSVYVLADVTGPVDGQAIKGPRDVALNKYDSAGNLVYSRTLGASGSASGFALGLSTDGSKVAVAGSITGALDTGVSGDDPKLSDSFVSVFSASGDEAWTQRRGAKADDQATGVAFAADGSVYVTGTASSAMPGGVAALGGVDGYLEGFSAAGVAKFTTQFGAEFADRPSGLAISGNAVIIAGVEGNHAVVRRYDLQATGAPTLGAERDLGALEGGEVAGVAVDTDGSVIVAGSTHNGALSVGTVTQAADGGRDAFVARLSADLQPNASETLTYIGGDADRTVSGLALSGGQVYLTGQTSVTPPEGQKTGFDGYAMAMDATTGAQGWSTTMRGAGMTDAPASISVAAEGASALDLFGFPSGTIDHSQSKLLVATSALRAGDQFQVAGGGGAAKSVTIDADETLDTLAVKIARASGFTAKVSIVVEGGQSLTTGSGSTAVTTVIGGRRVLKIEPINARAEFELRAGPSGRDALGALGLTEGRIEKPTTVKPKVGEPKADGKTYALGLPTSFDLSTPDGFKKAQSALMTATMNLRTAYRDMISDVTKPSTAKSGSVPKYMTEQLANYQAALNRLTA